MGAAAPHFGAERLSACDDPPLLLPPPVRRGACLRLACAAGRTRAPAAALGPRPRAVARGRSARRPGRPRTAAGSGDADLGRAARPRGVHRRHTVRRHPAVRAVRVVATRASHRSGHAGWAALGQRALPSDARDIVCPDRHGDVAAAAGSAVVAGASVRGAGAAADVRVSSLGDGQRSGAAPVRNDDAYRNHGSQRPGRFGARALPPGRRPRRRPARARHAARARRASLVARGRHHRRGGPRAARRGDPPGWRERRGWSLDAGDEGAHP